MKTYFFLLIFILSLTNCSTYQYSERDKALIEKYQMPEFSKREVNKFALEYLDHFDQSMKAAETGENLRLKVLLAETPKMARKAVRFAHKLSPEDAVKWVEWIQLISVTEFDN